MATTIQLRRDSLANWTAANPVLAQGELVIETDTKMLKSGDGVTAYSLLPYFAQLTMAGTAAPLMDGTPTPGVNTLLARQDHVHPTDTSRLAATDQAVNGAHLTGLGSGPAAPIAATDSILVAFAKLQALISAVSGALVYQGTWNASTNSPALASGTGTKGWCYKVNVAGTTAIDGNASWGPGDLIVFDGTAWDKIDGSSTEVSSVAGRVGAVVLSAADLNASGTPSASTFLRGDGVWATGTGTGDGLASLVNAEAVITAATALTPGAWNRIYATSAAYACPLPSAAGNAGRIVGARVDRSSTYFPTITGVFDDGTTSFLWVRGECVEWKSDGATWQMISCNSVSGTWTPSPVSLGGSGITFAARWTKNGNSGKFAIQINGTNIVSTANVTTLSIPFVLPRISLGMFNTGGLNTQSASAPVVVNTNGTIMLPANPGTGQVNIAGLLFFS